MSASIKHLGPGSRDTVGRSATMHWTHWLQRARRRDAVRPEGAPQEAARAALAAWPQPWLHLRARDAVLLEAHPGLPTWTGVPLAPQLGLPAADLFAGDDPVALIVALRRPLHGSAVRDWRCRLRHALGEPVDCLADGVSFLPPGGEPALLWVLRPAEAPAPPRPYDWTLDDEDDRRRAAQRGLAALLDRLHTLEPADGTAAAAELATALVATLTAPPRHLRDLGAAIVALAGEVQANTGMACRVAGEMPPITLDLRARRVLHRALRDLLAHVTQEWAEAALAIELQPGAAGGLRITLRRIAATGTTAQTVLTGASHPGGSGLGLFGVAAALASIGGTLQLAPAADPDLLARIDVPAGGECTA